MENGKIFPDTADTPMMFVGSADWSQVRGGGRLITDDEISSESQLLL